MQQLRKKKSERGVALLVALFALILITAVGLGLIFSSNSEFSVNTSFRQNHLAFFAARSGLEEARDRMRYKSTDTTTPAGIGIADMLIDETTTPPTPLLNSLGQTKSAIYIVNGSGINPTDPANQYFDDELCHEINNQTLIANSPGTYNIKCPHAAASLPTAASWAAIINAEPIPGGGTLSYKWTRLNLKMQETATPWCVLGYGLCNQQPGPDAVADQVCYDGSREFVLTDAMPVHDAPGGIGGIGPAQQLAAGMFFGTTSSHGNSGHSATTGSSTSSSSTSSSSSSTSSSTSGTSGTGSTSSSTTGTSSTTGSSTTGSSTTGSSTTGSSTTGTSATGTSSTGTSATGSSTTGTSATGSSTTGTSATGSSTTGTSATGTSTTGTSTTGTSATGTSATGTTTSGSTTSGSSTTGSSTTGSSTTGTSSTGTSATGTTTSGSSTTGTTTSGTSGSSTGGTTGGSTGTGGACSGVFVPTPPPASIAAPSCKQANGQPVYTLTTLAVSATGAKRMLQYEIARLLAMPVPAAVTMAGPNPTWNTAHSHNFGINGVNDPGCNAGGAVPAVGTTTDVGDGVNSASQVADLAEGTIAAQIAGSGTKPQNFVGAGCTSAQGGDDVQNVINVAPSYNTVNGLQALVESVIGSADVVTSDSSTITNWGTDSDPVVIAITGNGTIPNGAGILLVTGNMVASGAFNWDGLILVIGNGSVTFNGGGNGGINGALVVANIGNSSYAANPISANNLSQLGSPSFTFNGGGISSVNYNSCMVTNGAAHSTFKVLARREIIY